MVDIIKSGFEEMKYKREREAVIEKEGEIHKLTLSEHYDDKIETYYYSIEFHRGYKTIYDIKGANKYFDRLVKKHKLLEEPCS